MIHKENNKIDKTINYWWSTPKEELIRNLNIDPVIGLSKDQVGKHRLTFGSNTLDEINPASIKELIFEGVKEPMMVLLSTIAALSLLFGKPVEAVVMLFVVAAYIFVEFINKFRSDRTMSRLRELTQPTSKVMRDGRQQETPTSDVVVGDVVILSEGVRIPADMRLLESYGLLTNEASLTGESLPVIKDTQTKVDKDAPLAERRNCAFSGATVLAGEGKGIVMAVGNQSEIGTIARAVQAQRKERTFIQEAMTRLAKNLAVLAIIVSILIPAIGLLRGLNIQEMTLTWLALTFLMIPGQPPVIITMALALGSFELATKKLVVKRLRGVEVLGQVTAIVTDKTGTITENRMKVDNFILPDGKEVKPQELPKDIQDKIGLCLPRYSSDPTDIAVTESLNGKEKENTYSMLKGFSDGNPWRTLVYKDPSSSFQAISGEPERLIGSSEISSEEKEKLLEILRRETNKGSRVVGFAYKHKESSSAKDDQLAGSRLLSLAVLSDPVRAGVKEAVSSLRQAGITTYMVTGDHPATARTIARVIGIKEDILQGDELEKMDDTVLMNRLSSVRVFARISPSQKQRLVTLLKKKGETLAVIGDGVNDAPALRAASVGIAMGEIGTDLAKETADLVLTDDNYVHLPEAIAIGRKALDNFRKGLTYYLSAKAILLTIFLVPLVLGIPFPFAPIYIIMTELLMDLASSTIFVTEHPEPDVMTRPPQTIRSFLNRAIGLKILRNGLFLSVGILIVYLWIYFNSNNVTLAQSAAFVTWLIGHIMLALNLKQEHLPLIKQGIFSNRFGAVWLFSMIAFSVFITSISPVHRYLHTTYLFPNVWVLIIAVVIITTWWIELLKIVSLAKSNKQGLSFSN
jgi:Ca2+-transporting ATPase